MKNGCWGLEGKEEGRVKNDRFPTWMTACITQLDTQRIHNEKQVQGQGVLFIQFEFSTV